MKSPGFFTLGYFVLPHSRRAYFCICCLNQLQIWRNR